MNGKLFLFTITILLISSSQLVIASPPTADSSIVLYYKFNNDTSNSEDYTDSDGDLIFDYSQYSNNGTNKNGAVYNGTGGYEGDGKLNLNGINQYINIGTASELDSLNDFTFMFWLKGNEEGRDQSIVGGYRISSSYSGYIQWKSSNNLKFGFRNTTGDLTQPTGSIPLTKDEWYFIVVTREGDTIKSYVNGISDATGILSGPLFAYDSFNWIIGGLKSGTQMYNGTVDDFIVYNRSMELREIQNIYYDYNGKYQATEDFAAYGNVRFEDNNYYLNDTGSTGSIRVLSNDLTVSCNNANFISNNTDTSIAFHILSGYQNITFEDCNTQNYLSVINNGNASNAYVKVINLNSSNAEVGVNIVSGFNYTIINSSFDSCNSSIKIGSGTNVSITNITMYGTSNSLHDGIETTGTSKNITIDTVHFYNYTAGRGIFLSNVYGSTVHNIYGINNENGLAFFKSGHITAYNLFIEGEKERFAYNIKVDNSSDVRISDSNLSYSQYTIWSTETTRDLIIRNLTIDNTDQGSALSGYHIEFLDNDVTNTTQNYDGYNLGLKVYNCTNCVVKNNNFNELAMGVFAQSSNNLTIKDNTLSCIPLEDRGSYIATDLNEPQAAFILSPIYKSYTGQSIDVGNNVTAISDWVVKNANLSNNTITDCNTLLRDTGSINLTHDLNNYWLRKLQFPSNIIPLDKFYISDDYNNMSNFNNSREIGTKFINTYRFGTYPWDAYYEIHKTYWILGNYNTTISIPYVIYNLTTNYSIYESSSNSYIFTATEANTGYYFSNLSSDSYLLIYDYVNPNQVLVNTCSGVNEGLQNFGKLMPIMIIVLIFGIIMLFLAGQGGDTSAGSGMIIGTLIMVALGGVIIGSITGGC